MNKLEKIIAWGQYIHWADIQYQHRACLEESCPESEFIGVMSHWIAAQYVVIEGWSELEENDETIDSLLDSYSDYISTFRRCRNAVYHYQKKPLDRRIVDALKDEEHYKWLVAIKWEFERYLCIYPFKEYGLNKHSIELCNEYFRAIGWKPNENPVVTCFDAYYMCQDYITNGELHNMKHNQDNDEIISKLLQTLREVKPNFLLSELSRIDSKSPSLK